jgi:hypothetical protein
MRLIDDKHESLLDRCQRPGPTELAATQTVAGRGSAQEWPLIRIRDAIFPPTAPLRGPPPSPPNRTSLTARLQSPLDKVITASRVVTRHNHWVRTAKSGGKNLDRPELSYALPAPVQPGREFSVTLALGEFGEKPRA